MKLTAPQVELVLFPKLVRACVEYEAQASMHVVRVLVKRLSSGLPSASALHRKVKVWSAIKEKELYVVPFTPEGFSEQLLSRSANEVLLDDAEATVVVAVTVAGEEVMELSLASAEFALLASTPVPTASPTTAAARMAMMVDNMKTSAVHPHKRPLFLLP